MRAAMIRTDGQEENNGATHYYVGMRKRLSILSSYLVNTEAVRRS